MSEDKRPSVEVNPQTANSCEIIISTEKGEMRIVAGHEDILIETGGNKTRIQP